jgi:hypothetical protein
VDAHPIFCDSRGARGSLSKDALARTIFMKRTTHSPRPLAGLATLALAVAVMAPAALSPRIALAQDDSSTVEARARFREGVALYDEGKYEAARAKFKQAYALKQHPDVLLNLGWSSLKSGHPQEAEEAFNNYLRDAKDASPAKRAEAEKGLAQARQAGGGSSTPATTPSGSPSGTPSSTGGAGGAGGNASPNATPTGTGTMAQPNPGVGGAGGSGGASGSGAAGGTVGTDTPAPGEAQGEPVKQPLRADVLLGYTSDNLNIGVGVRVGKAVYRQLYVGGTFVYNFGTSYNVGTIAGTETLSTSAFYIGPEVGWDFVLAPSFTLRPYGGLGFASFAVSATFSNPSPARGLVNNSNSNTSLLFWPGVTAIYDIPNTSFMIGGDARLVFVPGTSVGYNGGPAFGIFATGGMRF